MSKKSKRRQHSREFKARIALEAIKGVKTVSQIASENEIHPVQVTQWKKQMQQGAVEVFGEDRGDRARRKKQQNAEEALERKIGQLVVEVDWLKKKCKQLGIDL